MLTDRERKTLQALCDALVPEVVEQGDPPAAVRDEPAWRAFLHRRGSALDLPPLVEAGLEEAPAHLRAQLRLLLRLMSNPLVNLLLTGRPKAVFRMSPGEAAAYLRSWARSRLPLKRMAFQALKQIFTFLFYAAHAADEANPNWPAIGFPGTPVPPREVPRAITPLAVTSDTQIATEICVIGSGAGGSAAAAVLSQAGRQVLLLERGGYYSQRDYTGDEYEMLQGLSLGKGLFATADNAFGLLAATCLGGSTVVNWCTSLRPPADVLEEWERDHGIDGLTGVEFRDALDAVERRLNVNTRESHRNPNNQALWDGARALGYRVEMVPRNVQGCGDCGPCAYGCPHRAKQDALVTYVQDAYAAGAQVLVHCAAERILTRGGSVVGVEATATDPASGRRRRVAVRCTTVVLAGGAIFSPALLLRSGIGNAMVGQRLRLHPVTAGVGIYAHPIELWSGHPQTAACTEFARLTGTHGFTIEVAPAHPGLAAMAIPWASGEDHKRQMARLAHLAAFIVLVRDYRWGRVTVTARGDPVVHYRLHPEDQRLMLRGLEEMGKIHLAAGAREIYSLHTRRVAVRRDEPDAATRFARGVRAAGIRPNAVALFSAHLMGGLPMGSDPRRAAVDPSGQVYGVRGLYVADASVFPSAPSVNPMIAIMAMAHRTTQRVAAG